MDELLLRSSDHGHRVRADFPQPLRLLEIELESGKERARQMETAIRQEETLRGKIEATVKAREEEAAATEKVSTLVRDLGFTFTSAFEDAIIEGEK